MKRWQLILLAGTTLLASVQLNRGQSVSDWRVYTVDDGMHQSACVAVSVSPNGKVVALHRFRSFVTELDGYGVHSIALPTLADAISKGPSGQLWAAVQDGLLEESKPGVWEPRPVPEVAAGSNVILSLYPPRWGQVLYLCPDRLMELGADAPLHLQPQVSLQYDQTRLGKFTELAAARDGGLWIAGDRGLGRTPIPASGIGFEKVWHDYLPPASLQIRNLHAPREDEAGGVTVVAESSNGQPVVARFDGLNWTEQSEDIGAIQRAWQSGDKVQWVATENKLLRQTPGQTNLAEYQEISARRYYDVAMEPGGAFWLATSSGLFRYAPPLWRQPFLLRQINSLTRCLTEAPAGRLWFLADGKLHSLQGENHREFALPEPAVQNGQFGRALFPLKNGRLLLRADKKLIRFDPDSGSFGEIPPAHDGVRQMKPLGLLEDGSLCVQSGNSERTAGKRIACYFDRFDGTQFQPLADPPPDADYSILFAARNGDLWLSGDQGTARYHEKEWQTFPISERTVPETILGFTELTDGRIWAATQDKLWEFDGHNWSSVYAGFDHINALQCARDGSVWVADDVGVHRYFQKVWIENSREDGLPDATVQDLFEDHAGQIWAGTPHGLSQYHPEADPDPPRTFIQTTDTRETPFREGDTVAITVGGEDKWKFTSPDRLLYSYKLDYRDWSPFAETRTFTFSSLPAGDHVCEARAMDRNGNIDPKPALLEFAVIVPWYKEIHLLLIAFAGAAAAIFFAGLALNRHRRLLRSYAEVEKKVAERTHELEIAGQELLQSQKMTALGTLAAGIAHDFNNILSIVKGSAQIIEENPGNPEKIRTRVDRIKTVVEQGAGIVNAMLGFSSGAGEQAGSCDLNAVVADTLKLLGDRFLREVEVKCQPAPQLSIVHASKNFIQQILLNLIFNGAEAMSGRKQIVLSTQTLDRLPEGLMLAPAQANAYVSVSVSDSGCGIPPENLPRIFEPFFTTKALSVRRGTGLGLSMVYELAKKMGAGLAVESVVDHGSVFTLILPVQEQPADARPEL
jgi:signal transduction histidine kinase/ligand-binding sensor domain-containing protein